MATEIDYGGYQGKAETKAFDYGKIEVKAVASEIEELEKYFTTCAESQEKKEISLHEELRKAGARRDSYSHAASMVRAAIEQMAKKETTSDQVARPITTTEVQLRKDVRKYQAVIRWACSFLEGLDQMMDKEAAIQRVGIVTDRLEEFLGEV